MKTWLHFYIEYTIRNREPFYKEIGWSLGLKNKYVVLSGVRSWPFVGKMKIIINRA